MKIVLLNSGGKDSLACAMLLTQAKVRPVGVPADEPLEIHSLYVDLGWQNNEAAMPVAEKIAAKYCASHKVIKVTGAEWHCDFPNHNGAVTWQAITMPVIAAMYAGSLHTRHIVYGASRGPVDGDKFADDFDTLYDGYTKALAAYFWSGSVYHDPPSLTLPIINMRPHEVWEIVKSDPLWKETVTCREDPPCGKCPKCGLRNYWLALPQ